MIVKKISRFERIFEKERKQKHGQTYRETNSIYVEVNKLTYIITLNNNFFLVHFTVNCSVFGQEKEHVRVKYLGKYKCSIR